RRCAKGERGARSERAGGYSPAARSSWAVAAACAASSSGAAHASTSGPSTAERAASKPCLASITSPTRFSRCPVGWGHSDWRPSSSADHRASRASAPVDYRATAPRAAAAGLGLRQLRLRGSHLAVQPVERFLLEAQPPPDRSQTGLSANNQLARSIGLPSRLTRLLGVAGRRRRRRAGDARLLHLGLGQLC